MICKNCSSSLSDGAKFCGKCGASILNEKLVETNTPTSTSSSVAKKVFQIIAIILFILSLGTISSSNNITNEWLEIIYDIFSIVALLTFISLITNSWGNRKKGKNQKWFGWRWIMFLIVLSLVGFGTAIFSRALAIAQEKVIASTDSWAVYTAPDSTFSARFPSNPTHDSRIQDTENGTLKIDAYKQADHTASIMYAVNISEFPTGTDLSDTNRILENTVNLSAENGTILNSEKTMNNGYQAITYLIEFNHPTEVARIRGLNVLIGNRLYQLLTVYDKPQENLSEYDKFVGSFEVK